ncbi:uncharacterized protein KD926_007424 [Aspergillus affinis]|uniref:uncharacterized protein n=1 Tax=Aspergillus affinis TaxID=1070780 RepID=UPI0022FE5F7C|nr:uncharacterized protein KD926_007424 [Aspergillus affinis]KAI9041008.1 hypothetical protein KD926_007424 [Aspergillus affinis]
MAFAPSVSAFSLPLQTWRQPVSLRTAQYEPKKRKKGLNDLGDADIDTEGETTDAASETAPSGLSLTLSPDEAHQYRIAGLPFDREIPGGNFPHGPAKDEKLPRQTKGEILKELSSLSSPIYPPQSAAHQGNLRLQHFGVLSSVLHRCLLQRDYIRAGRAWGLLLREEYNGTPLDVRVDERWGIGAEILLRRGRQISDNACQGDNEAAQATEPSKLLFTRKGFEDAKQYYETLIVQHPFRKVAPDDISSLHFYAAMFGLWIYVTQEENQMAFQKILENQENSSEISEQEDATSDLDGQGGSRNKTRALLAEVKKNELGEAQRIAARMDEKLTSPPYSDSSDLLELRGMVSLWIGDLFVSSLPYPEENDEYDVDRTTLVDDQNDSIQIRREQKLAADKRGNEMKKSQVFFEKARRRGKGMASTLEDFHINDDDDDDDFFGS